MQIANFSNNYAAVGITSHGPDAVSGASSYIPSADDQLAHARQEIKQHSDDFQDLRSAFKAGNVASALQAYGSIQQDIKAAATSAGKSLFDPASPIGQDFQAIGKALDSGDLSSAKQAFRAFTHDIRNAHRASNQSIPRNDTADASGSSAPANSAPLVPPTVLSAGLDLTA